MRYRLMCLFMCCTAAQAGIYKTYDKNGNVIFSDIPSNDAQQVETQPIAIVPALPRAVIDEKTKPTAKTDKNAELPKSYQMSVTGLTPQMTLRKEDKAINVGLEFTPPLHKDHQLMVAIDGQALVKNNMSPLIDPSKLERGQHRLEVKIVDKKQNVLQSEVIDFFVQQVSVANKPKK